MKFVFVLLLLLFTISCNRNPNECKSEPDCVYMELNSKDIESAIIEYRQKLKKSHERSLNKGDSIYVGVYMKDINDSIKRYVLYPIIDYDFLEFTPPLFICYVSGETVFFNSEAGSPSYKGNEKIFKVSDKKYWMIIKRYFPNRYREYQKKGYFSNRCYEHSKNCYLTFINDSLVDKTYQTGITSGPVRIKYKGKEELY